MSTLHRWDALTREEIGALAAEALLVVPVGSTEQHGPHLATGTDALLATAIAERAAEASRSRRTSWKVETRSESVPPNGRWWSEAP